MGDSNSGFGYALDPLDISGGRAAGQAAQAQRDASNNAKDATLYMYNQSRNDLAPWRQVGEGALKELANPEFMRDFQGDPGFQFRMQEGNRAINNAASAKGLGTSGRTLKELTKFGQDYSSNEFNNAYNRNMTRLSSLAGLGSGANNQGVNQASQAGKDLAANAYNLGNVNAANTMAQSNAKNNMITTAVGAYFSDQRLKTDIKPISKTDLAEMKKHLKAVAYKYKDSKFGEGEWIGVMAQDLEKSKLGRTIVSEDEFGNKKINLKKAVSLFLASMAEA